MNETFYRFRKIDSLLGKHQELISQTIYFSPGNDLNDPMEGYRNLFWDGDVIIWTNFFRHYVMCLEGVFRDFLLNAEDKEIKDNDILVFRSIKSLPTQSYKDLINGITSEFISNASVAELISQITTRTSHIRRDELNLYLASVHHLALDLICKHYSEHQDIHVGLRAADPEKDVRQLLSDDLIKKIELTLQSDNGNKTVQVIFAISKSNLTQLPLAGFNDKLMDFSKKNLFLITFGFPERYIYALERLMYPNWYTACFMTNCTNSSIWGNYGDNHQGVCMIFEADENSCLSLYAKSGAQGSSKEISETYDNLPFKFHKIKYEPGFGEVDFFRSIGRLPIPDLNYTWYVDPNTKTSSVCSEGINKDINNWRENYWERFYRDITKKSVDWEYENEYRLILRDGEIIDYTNVTDRALKYDFSSLKGIIFGIKTTLEDKLKIIEIIHQKCQDNNIKEFKFYQAFYSEDEKRVSHYPLPLVGAIKNKK